MSRLVRDSECRLRAPALLCATLAALLFSGCAKEIPEPGGEVVDYQSPKNLVSHIFWAARTGNTDKLASLCLPEGGNAAVARVCSVARGDSDWASFKENFSKGKLNGEPRISGDRAVQKFLFGPEGATPETMSVVRREGRWFLESF